METLETDRLAEVGRVGKDELNLAEFPFAILHTRPPKNAPLVLEFRDGEKEWTVEGSPKFGLPMAPDIAVYVVLMEISREQGFPVQVEFSRWEVIRRLGWGDSGRSYERLTTALDRLVGVTIRAKNAFYDAKSRRWERSKAFHILEAYDIASTASDPHATLPGFGSWVRWSPEISTNLQSGYIKSLDVGLFLSLKSAISQALYRYLDKKRFDGKPQYRIAIKTLAFEHLGMSRGYFPSEVKHKLKPAHQELIGVGLLSAVDYAPMRSGEEMVIYHFAPRATAETPALPPATLDPLAQQLAANGVSRQAAQMLAKAAPEECRLQLEYLPFREARDPGAVLVKAIREGWAAPPAYLQAQAKQQRADAAKKKQSATATAAAEKTTAEDAFSAWWDAQPLDQRDVWTATATALLRSENKVLADFGAKCPDAPLYREALRAVLKRVSGYRAG